jgi:peptidoglycan hydrolase-like protein with peptidoglycan-binding domain
MAEPLGTSRMRTEYSGTRCNRDRMTTVRFHPGTSLLVDRSTAEAWEAFSAVMAAHDYRFRESAGGTYNCRKIGGTSRYSMHAYGLAVDLNPSRNPFALPLRTDQPAAFRRDVEKIITRSGRQVFQWGGRWSKPDAMHWQIGALRSELRTGLITPVVVEGPGKSGTPGCLRHGDRGDRVKDIQEVLLALGYPLPTWGADGDFGDETEAAVRAFQSDVGIDVDGVWGPMTENYATGVLASGDEGPAVEAAQRLLIRAGCDLPKWGADGDYGDETIAAVKALQRAAGILADGIFGPVTRRVALVRIRRG